MLARQLHRGGEVYGLVGKDGSGTSELGKLFGAKRRPTPYVWRSKRSEEKVVYVRLRLSASAGTRNQDGPKHLVRRSGGAMFDHLEQRPKGVGEE